MKAQPNRPPRPVLLFLLGLCGGLTGESLLFLHSHCARIESLLTEDLRVVAFLDRKTDESRLRVVEERLRALPGVENVRFLAPEESLAELEARDPDLVKSVALLGDNPLPGAFEIQPDVDGIAALPDLIKSAEAVPELGDIRYKPLQAGAILQVRFYRRFLTLALSVAACLWFLAAAALLWQAAPALLSAAHGAEPAWKDGMARFAWSALGTALGMAAAGLLAYPVAATMLSAWPRAGFQLALLAAGGLAGPMLSSQPPQGTRRTHRPTAGDCALSQPEAATSYT